MRPLLCYLRHKKEPVDDRRPGSPHALDYCSRCERLLPTNVFYEVSLGYQCGVFKRRPWLGRHALAYERWAGEPFPGEVEEFRRWRRIVVSV